MGGYLTEKDIERVKKFYQKQGFKGKILDEFAKPKAKKSGGGKTEGVSIRKKSDAGAAGDSKGLGKRSEAIAGISGKLDIPEVSKKVKEEMLAQTRTSPLDSKNAAVTHLAAQDHPKLNPISHPIITPKPANQLPTDPRTSEENYKHLVFGILAGITADKLEAKPPKFHLSTEEARQFIKTYPNQSQG